MKRIYCRNIKNCLSCHCFHNVTTDSWPPEINKVGTSRNDDEELHYAAILKYDNLVLQKFIKKIGVLKKIEGS